MNFKINHALKKENRIILISIILIISGLTLRILNIFQIGHYFDIIQTQALWGKNGVKLGVLGFWQTYTEFFDYMPGSLALETSIYHFAKHFSNPEFAFNSILKFLNLLTDLIISMTIILLPYFFKIQNSLKKQNRILIAAIFFSIPSILFVSSIWGQNDSLIGLIGVLSVLVFTFKHLNGYQKILISGFLLVFGFWIKQQAILFLPCILGYLLFKKSFIGLFQFLSSIISSGFLFFYAFYYVNGNRLIESFQTVKLRPNLTTNGANNFWVIVNKVGRADTEKLFGIEIENLSKLILIVFGGITTYIFYKYIQSWLKISNKVPVNALLEFTLILNVIYFLFGTKMHSRYLHIGIICGFLLLTWLKYFKNKLFIFAIILVNIGYTINQLTVFWSSSPITRPSWLDKLLFNGAYNQFLSKISGITMLLSMVIFIYVFILNSRSVNLNTE
jgi:hypothetical protein